MELVSLGLEALQSAAEHAASYRFGQSLLRQLDRTLWVVEKCARWAVPPPLDVDERPPPVLVRPLPWPLFLALLVTLRVARESISLANLVMGKPPLRSADVVVFIQGRRRYLRTLKYQGNRMMRARTSTQPQQPWYHSLLSLFQLTMCFRRESHYGNNNTTSVTDNDEVMVVKRQKRGRQESPAVSSGEITMERLIEKMMVDLDAESDEDNNSVHTNAGVKNDRSECTESDQDAMCQTSTPYPAKDTEISQTNGDDIHFSPKKTKNSSSTPEKQEKPAISTPEKQEKSASSTPEKQEKSASCTLENQEKTAISTPEKQEDRNVPDNHTIENTSNQTFQISYVEVDPDKTVTENSLPKPNEEKRKLEQSDTEYAIPGNSNQSDANFEDAKSCEDSSLPTPPEKNNLSLKRQSENLIKSEAAYNSRRPTKKEHKIVNGRTVKSVPSKKKGVSHPQSRNSNEAVPHRVLP